MRPPRNHYHWLRGSFVTDLIVGQGVDVVTATALGGWSGRKASSHSHGAVVHGL